MAIREVDSTPVAPPPFALRPIDLGDTITLGVSGEFDAAAAPKLQAAILAANANCVRLVLDLTELTFIDSMGLNLLLAAKKLSHEQSFQLFVIPSENEAVTRLFALTDTERVLL